MKLIVNNIEFSYNSNAIISNLSFSLNQGEMLCVLGENGAGKSTLLKCLNHILKPKAGSILIDNEALLSMTKNKIARKVSYVPQKHQEAEITVFEAILMGRRPYIQFSLTHKDYEIVENTIKKLGLENLSNAYLNNLSGGELQKVIIARALAQSTNILLLDEPTSNLDIKNQMDIMELLQSLVINENFSLILAIHDLNTAFRFGTTFLFLKDNKVYAILKKEEINPKIIKETYNIDVDIVKVNEHTIVIPNCCKTKHHTHNPIHHNHHHH